MNRTSTLIIRAIEPRDDAAVASIIRTVMPEFGANGPGFAIHDPEVDTMYAAYNEPRAAYFVAELDASVIAGAGMARLAGGDHDTCELRKMYMLPPARGTGLGQRLLDITLTAARGAGYRVCYLETLVDMTAARSLYEKNGFVRRTEPLGATGHFGCDCWYDLRL